MSSSDSEDDYYGNISKKLQNLKSQYVSAPIEDVYDLSIKDLNKGDSLKSACASTIVIDDCNTSFNNADNEELTLDAIIAKHSKPKRGRKRKSAEIPPEPQYEQETRSRRTTRRTSKLANGNENVLVENNDDSLIEICSEPSRRGRRGRVSNKSREATTGRGRGRGRSRGGTPPSRRGRGRNTRNIVSNIHHHYPTFSVGNTDFYPDMCDNQELFSTKTNDVEIIEDVDPLDNDNEELSVKVHWQSVDVIRFNLRRHQKLAPIFKYFSDKENIAKEKLLLMYNNKLLKDDDTPDSINYNIAKFIDGGIVNNDLTGLLKHDTKELNGLKIKFQCQNLKKPFETTVNLEENFTLAMMKCAEHLEIALDRLKFYFDGDLISSKTTPKALDLEGGECFDVKICS